jgi:hypothetical protein
MEALDLLVRNLLLFMSRLYEPAHCSSDRFRSYLHVAFSQINQNFLHFLDFRFEIWHTPPAPQCATFVKSASTSDHRVAGDQPKCAGFDSNMLTRFWQLPVKLNFRDFFEHSCSCITLPSLPTSLPIIC